MNGHEAEPRSPTEFAAIDYAVGRSTTIRSAIWTGMKRGALGSVVVAVPIVLVGMILGSFPAAFGIEVPNDLMESFAVGTFLGLGFFGVVVGGLIGLSVGIHRAARGSTGVRSENPERSAGRVRRRIWPKALALTAILLIGSALAIWLYLGFRVRSGLDDAIAETERDDLNWRLADILKAREPVPDPENSALVVSEIVSRLPPDWPTTPTPPGWPVRVSTPLMEAFQILARLPAGVPLDEESAEVIRAELGRYEEVVRLARTLKDYRRGRHALEIATIFDVPQFPRATEARSVARLLKADAMIRAGDGDLDGAIASCRSILGAGRSIGDDRFMIPGLIRFAIRSVAVETALRVLALGEPSDSALAALRADVLDELADPLLPSLLRSERALIDESLRRLIVNGARTSGPAGAAPPGMLVQIFSPVARHFGAVYLRYCRALLLDWMREAIAISRRPSHERPRLWEDWEANQASYGESRIGSLLATLPVLTTSSLRVVDRSETRSRAELGAFAILLDAERHRQKTGEWPADVDAIDPAILPEPPADPYSGSSYLIEHIDGQFNVYSIGSNGVDDHGRFDPRLWNHGGADDVGASAFDVNLRNQPPIPPSEVEKADTMSESPEVQSGQVD